MKHNSEKQGQRFHLQTNTLASTPNLGEFVETPFLHVDFPFLLQVELVHHLSPPPSFNL